MFTVNTSQGATFSEWTLLITDRSLFHVPFDDPRLAPKFAYVTLLNILCSADYAPVSQTVAPLRTWLSLRWWSHL